MPSKWVTMNFELKRLINRTCNFRTEAYTKPCETSRCSFFVKIVNGFKPLIIFTKKFHLRCLTRFWIRLRRSSHLRIVLENSCSEICSQNPWKIPMKKFIFSKVAGWQSATFSRIPWGFHLIKKFVKIVFFACFFLR